VLAIGWWFVRTSGEAGRAQVAVPVFALAFLGFVAINSVAPALPWLAPVYAALKPWLALASGAGLIVAIAALGLGTSLRAVLTIGWGHAGVFLGATATILLVVLAGLALT
jgi:uncharacterized membrane protein YadS